MLSAIRAKLGLDEVEWFVVGAAPTPPEVLEFFLALGHRRSASCGGCRRPPRCATLNPPGADQGRHRAARRSPGVELKLAEDGELLVRGADR